MIIIPAFDTNVKENRGILTFHRFQQQIIPQTGESSGNALTFYTKQMFFYLRLDKSGILCYTNIVIWYYCLKELMGYCKQPDVDCYGASCFGDCIRKMSAHLFISCSV